MSYEFVQETVETGEIHHKVKYKYKRTGENIIYRSIADIPLDEPLCEFIEDFGIPVFRKKGLNHNIRYVVRKHLELKLDVTSSKFRYHEDKIIWIHKKENLTKKEYKAQIGNWYGATELPLNFKSSEPILYSLGDAIQILSKLQSEEKRAKLIRKLIIKIEELQSELNKRQKEYIENLRNLLEQLDIICYDWIKEHHEVAFHKGKKIYGNFAGYIHLWDDQHWQMIIDIHTRIRIILGLPVPKKENAGLHHSDRPYRKVYPHVATKGQIIDKRWDHDDPRQKRFIR